MFDHLKINPKAQLLCTTLQNHGFQSFIVGGCVRDLLMNQVPKDWDITTDALPEEVMKIFPKHYATGLQHGTITVNIENELFEVTTFRVEGKYSDGRRPDEVKFVTSIEEDLSRRDLTINAIAYDPVNKKLVDPFNGINDIKNKIIKAVGVPAERFLEDGLRIMRVARFASRFEFEVAEETKQDMAATSYKLSIIAVERIKDELFKILMSQKPSIGLHLLVETDGLKYASPLLEESNKIFIEIDNLVTGTHPETKLASLFAIGFSDSQVEEALKYLKCSNFEIRKVMFIRNVISQWLMKKNTECEIKMMAFIKNNCLDHYDIAIKQCKTAILSCMKQEYQPSVMQEFDRIANLQVWSRKDLAIDGNDIISLGVSPGPRVKNLLDKAYNQILTNPENNNGEFLRRFVKLLLLS